MARWLQTIKIKDLLGSEEGPDAIIAAADGIKSRLPEGAPVSQLTKARDMANVDPETALLVFNDGMDRIYDWADRNRVWLA